MNDTSRLLRGLAELGIETQRETIEQLVRYYELLTDKNRVMNLTAITGWEDVVDKHFIDSSAIVCLSSSAGAADGNNIGEILKEGVGVCDVGTGAGLPGLVLAILYPESRFTLMDALRKRIDFLSEVVMELGLSNVTLLHGRAEDIARQSEHREAYDICVSRAVSALSVLAEYCLPLVKVGGCFLAYKGEKASVERTDAEGAIALLGGNTETVLHMFNLPESGLPRSVIEIDKIEPTPGKYPRRAGIPEKKPLF